VIFEWDERKRLGNLRKHGLDFRDCAALFTGPHIALPDERYEYRECRFIALGLLTGRVVAVAYAETEQTVRIISMRKANRSEQTSYFQSVQD
jgi:uncharacterized DUF497 family protein